MAAILRLWPLALLCAAGCTAGVGDGTGGDAGTVVAPGDGLTQATAGGARWQLYDLAGGAVTAASELPDLASNPAYRDGVMVFRRIDAGDAAIGQAAGSFARQDDEVAGRASPGTYWIAAFETTRAQWRRLAGSEPWAALLPGTGGGADDALPALGLSLDGIRAMLASHPRLALPSPVQWEVAARAGSAAVWPWGDSHLGSVAGLYARTAETGGGAGPLPVASLGANAWQLYDVCGNAAEAVADGGMRGGSWADALSLARPANRRAIDPATAWEGLGVRLTYAP